MAFTQAIKKGLRLNNWQSLRESSFCPINCLHKDIRRDVNPVIGQPWSMTTAGQTLQPQVLVADCSALVGFSACCCLEWPDWKIPSARFCAHLFEILPCFWHSLAARQLTTWPQEHQTPPSQCRMLLTSRQGIPDEETNTGKPKEFQTVCKGKLHRFFLNSTDVFCPCDGTRCP